MDEQNPFENRPGEAPPVPPGENPFENAPGGAPAAEVAPVVGRSRLALASGLGFVVLAAVFVFGVLLPGNLTQTAVTVVGMVIAAFVALFFLLDNLKVRPSGMTERKARFFAGLLLGMLLLLCLAAVPLLAGTSTPDLTDLVFLRRLTTVYALIVLAHASFALFLYSMLWEES